MKLLNVNLEKLNNPINSNIFNLSQYDYSLAPNNIIQKRILIPKHTNNSNEKLMFKNGDKMRIPGVLDYTGAKLPGKKKKKLLKGQEGLELFEFISPDDGQAYYMRTNEPFNENGERMSYTDRDLSNPAPTVLKLDEVTVVGNKMKNTARKKLERHGMSKDVLKYDRGVELVNKLSDDQLEDVKNFGKRFTPLDKPKFGEYVDKDLQEMVDLFYKTDVTERLKASRPDLSNKELEYISNIVTTHPAKYGNSGDELNILWNGATGYQKDNQIILNPFAKRSMYSLMSTLSHEYRHQLQKYLQEGSIDSTGYSYPEWKLLHEGYKGMKGYNYLGRTIKDEKGYLSTIEKGAINTQLRFALLNEYVQKYKRTPTIQELNEYIKKLPNRYLIDLFEHINGYTNFMLKNERQDADKMKDALQEVAMNQQPALLLGKSGIKIKKKNRGKFTSYCGGTVTQDCINRAKRSGNKTLIKRAVFAENSRKWKH